jgi:hypothetical protein
VLASPAALTRTQQQQLLEQLLYQELESQGLLSSPFASFVNKNCAGLLQGQGGPMADLLALFGSQLQGVAPTSSDRAIAGTPLLGTPAVLSDKPVPAPGLGLAAASPNSISIATALALLAANAQAKAAAQLPNVSTAAQLSGISLTTPRMKLSVEPTSADASANMACYNGSTPIAPQPSRDSTSSGGCTDGELTGSDRTDRSCDYSPSCSVLGPSDLEAQRKVLFASADFVKSPDSQSLVAETLRSRVEGGAKENASPNVLLSSVSATLLR